MKFSAKILFVMIVLLSAVNYSQAQNRNTNHKSEKNTKGKVVKKTQNKKVVSKAPKTKVVTKSPNRKVVVVKTLPKSRVLIQDRGRDYYYADNRYYSLRNGQYYAVRPVIGFRIQILPTIHRRVVFQNRMYYVANGIFYANVNNGYEVVNPEIGTVVYELSIDKNEIDYNGQILLEDNGVLYEQVQVNGVRAYEVVGFI